MRKWAAIAGLLAATLWPASAFADSGQFLTVDVSGTSNPFQSFGISKSLSQDSTNLNFTGADRVSVLVTCSDCSGTSDLAISLLPTVPGGTVHGISMPVVTSNSGGSGPVRWDSQYVLSGISSGLVEVKNASTGLRTVSVWVAESTDGFSAASGSFSADDENRLDLIWWGVWAIVGVMLWLVIANYWERAWEWLNRA